MKLFLFLLSLSFLHADEPLAIGIEEKLGQSIDLNLLLTDENGQKFLLKDYLNKPTVLTLVYYRCPGICSPLLEGVTKVVDLSKMNPGQQYQLLTVSFDPTETSTLALHKKQNYLKTMQKPPMEGTWKWAVGDQQTIQKLTDAVGFRYKQEGSDFVHSAAIMVLSPQGKISRYLYGIKFLPFDLQMAVTEAQAEKWGPTIAKMLKYCFSYDNQAKKYVVNVTRIAGGSILLLLTLFFLWLVFGPRPKEKTKE